jgi:hypothetical protein
MLPRAARVPQSVHPRFEFEALRAVPQWKYSGAVRRTALKRAAGRGKDREALAELEALLEERDKYQSRDE